MEWLAIGLAVTAALAFPLDSAVASRGQDVRRSRDTGRGQDLPRSALWGGRLLRWWPRRKPAVADGAWVASLAEASSACLEAGIPLRRSLEVCLETGFWGEVGEAVLTTLRDPSRSVVLALKGAGEGRDLESPVSGTLLVSCVRMADEHGVPAASAMARAAELARAASARQEALAMLVSGPRASMQVIGALPLLGPLIVWLIGLDLGEVYAGWWGLSCITLGIGLAMLGRTWARRLLRRAGAAQRVALSSGATAEIEDAIVAITLLALALRSGQGLVESLEAVAGVPECPAGSDLATVAAALRWGESPADAWSHVDAAWGPAAVLWSVAVAAGAPPAALLDAAALRMAQAERRRLETAAQRAGVLLVLPLGACFLPAFLLTTVVPVVITLGAQLAA